MVADVQRNLVEWSKRGAISRRYRAKDDKKMIATWSLDLDKILQVFRVRSVSWNVMAVANISLLEGTSNHHCNDSCRSSQCRKHSHSRSWG